MQLQNNNDLFVSKDLHISALCYAKGMKLIRTERQGHVCYFLFADRKRGEQLRQEFIARSVNVNAMEFVNALRVLKDLVFAQ